MTFWERIQILCKEKQTTPTALCKSLGLSTSMVTRWKNGTIPNNATLTVIAEALDVDANYLMWGSGEKEKSPDESDLYSPQKAVSFNANQLQWQDVTMNLDNIKCVSVREVDLKDELSIVNSWGKLYCITLKTKIKQ